MPINHTALRRQYEACVRDRQPQRFVENLREALDAKELRPEDFSVAQLFEEFVEDGREILRAWRRGEDGPPLTNSERLAEAAGYVSTALFTNITGPIIFSAVHEGYNLPELVFSRLVPTQQTQFNGEKIPGMMRLGDESEIVNEGDNYPELGIGEDWIETPETVKRGGIVSLTKESIFFDRTGLLIQRAREVGEFLGVNKEKRIIDAVIDENSTKHRYKWRGTTYATYQTSSPWINVKGSNALVDWTDIDAAEQLFDAMVDPYTGEPILVTPKHLIVTRQLLYTARRIVSATEIRTATDTGATTTIAGNPVTPYEIVTSQLLASRMGTDTNWYLGDIGKAFRYMENWSLTTEEQGQSSDAAFERDLVMRFKASERGAAATFEPRAMVKNTVA